MIDSPHRPDTANSNADSRAHPLAQTGLPLLTSRNYRCQCGQPVYFRNSVCLTCGTALGYDCDHNLVLPLMPVPTDVATTVINPTLAPLWQRWQAALPTADGMAPAPAVANAAAPPLQLQNVPGQQSAPPVQAPPQDPSAPPVTEPTPANIPPADTPPAEFYKRCINQATPAACNWLVPAHDPHDFCRACRLNRTIPDLTDPNLPDNGYLWGLVETAKRRLVSSLIALRLPVASRVSEDPQQGLMFDLLRAPNGAKAVMTGHESGLITLNVDEADDATRELARKAMHEPYRTLLGHFRHEVGHYYWDRLIAGTSWLDGFHSVFGDESADYAASLQRNYSEGPPVNWPQHFVSAYASSHPWEDWAECWAHYMHMRDAVDTARGFGLMSSLDLAGADLEFTPFTIDTLWQPDDAGAADFLAFLNHWSRLTMLINQMTRSMGQSDFYPFALAPPVVAKLHFIHLLVTSRHWERAEPPAPAPAMEAPPVLMSA